MRSLGTILPTVASLARGDAAAETVERKKRQTATRLLSECEHRHIDGEDRYYDGDRRFAVVSRSGTQVLWFALGADGHWYATK